MKYLAPFFVLVFALAPLSARAHSPAADEEAQPAAPAGEESSPESGESVEVAAPDDADAPVEQPTVTEVEREPAPSGGGVGGAIVDPDDPNAGRAQSDLEGESLDTTIEGIPERLPKLQAAGWWTTFAAVALATTGGVFAGVAETRQDSADRLAYNFDLDTGRAQLYGPVADEYEQLLADGNLYQGLARGFLIAGGATLVAGIVLFSLDASQRRRAKGESTARVRVVPGAGGLSLQF